jgi:REP-associated tyrosine transposase
MYGSQISGVEVGVGVKDSGVTDRGTKVKVGLKTRNVAVGLGRLTGVGVDMQDARRTMIKVKRMESASLLANCKDIFNFLDAILDMMNEVFKVYPHNPPHYFVSNAMYMITGAVLQNQALLNENRKREFVLETLLERAKVLGWNLQAWAILNNHYHFIAQAPNNANTLSKLIRQLHSLTAIQLNRWDKTPGRQVWFNYWDSCITFEKSYLARLRYVHMNPIKHRLVDDALDYPFCSYRWFVEQGNDHLKEQVFKQPIDALKIFDNF